MKRRYLFAISLNLFALDASAQLAPGQAVPRSDPNGAYCREYTQQVVIGGIRRDSYGTACMQPDGAWKILTTDQQAAPEQVEYVSEPVFVSQPRYVVPPTVYYQYETYPYAYPYYAPYRGPYYRGGYRGGSSVNITIGNGGGHYDRGYRGNHGYRDRDDYGNRGNYHR